MQQHLRCPAQAGPQRCSSLCLAAAAIAAACTPTAFARQTHSQVHSHPVHADPPIAPEFKPPIADDRPPAAGPHPMPPLHLIPPMPMPQPPAPADDGFPGMVQSDHIVVYDARTARSEVVHLPGTRGDAEDRFAGALPLEGPVDDTAFPSHLLNPMSIVTNPTAYPHSTACKLAMRFGSTWYVCSGTMINANVVLTAGHCINMGGSNGTDGRWADQIVVIPAWDGTGFVDPPPGPGANESIGHFGYAQWSGQAAAGGSWVSHGNFDQDYAYVTLDRSVGFLTGWLGFATGGSCSTIRGRTYSNTSYPAEFCGQSGLHNGRTMYHRSGTVDACPGNQLEFNTSPGCLSAAWGGMSGSSAYFSDSDGGPYAHAVSSTSNRSSIARYARLDSPGFDYLVNTFIPAAQGAAFDLQAMNCRVSPTGIQAGSTTSTQSVIIANRSRAADSRTWTVRVYLSTNDFISAGDTLLSTQTFTWSFSALSTVRLNMAPLTIPANTPSGTYWIGVIIDPASDGNTANNATHNWDAARVTITGIPAPSNDRCFNPRTISLQGPLTGTTAGADTDGSALCGGTGGGGRDVWFTYSAFAAGTLRLTTCGSAFDTVLSVHAFCPGDTANQIACNDDASIAECAGTLQSALEFNVTPSATYLIRLAGYNGQSGSYTLHASLRLANCPSVLQHPAPATACRGGSATFSIATIGDGPMTYQWRRGSTIVGADSPALTISPVSPADAGTYTCTITNACGSAVTNPAALTICNADINCIDGVTVQDCFDYLARYFAADPRADLNDSGTVTLQDLFDFLAAYFAGCP